MGSALAGVAGTTGNAISVVANSLGGGAYYDPSTGSVNGPVYSVGGNIYTDVGSALNKVAQTAETGWTMTTNGGNGTPIATGETVDFSAGANLVATATSDGVQYSLDDNIALSSVNAGNTIIDGSGVTLQNGNALTTGGLSIVSGSTVNMGGNKVTGVDAGGVYAGSMDAVNGSQLNDIVLGLSLIHI